MTEKEKITIFRICLESNIITLSQIEKWAENIVMNSEITGDDYILLVCLVLASIGIYENLKHAE
jgi:hypothetical protein